MVEYTNPRPQPQVSDQGSRNVSQWASQEFEAIARALQGYDLVQLNVQHREPTRPRAGMLVVADGTDWNPGSGEGLYRFTSGGTWKYLG